jgi:ankyrin repeat protein
MKGRRTLQQLIQDAGISAVRVRQPLPAPSQPSILASEEDHILARNLLVEQRKSNPEWKDPNKQLKRIFKSSKEKGKLKDVSQWEFSQDEVDQVLSAVIDKPTSSPGLVQAFISLGAKVNYIEAGSDKDKNTKLSNVSARRRSTVLQRAATLRKADSVGILASSGADQTTLDEALRAALSAKDYSCIQELLRHGADLNKYPTVLADAVRASDQNLIRLLLRAPKALRPEIVSSCLPAAVQQKSEPVVSLLIGYGGNANFNDASALCMAITAREYRIAVALASGYERLTEMSLQRALGCTLELSTSTNLRQFLELLFCCGLPAHASGLPMLFANACKRDDTPLAQLLIDYGVPTSVNEAEALRSSLLNGNWELAEKILEEPITATHASVALDVVPNNTPKPARLRIIGSLVQHGANGPSLGRWLVRAVEENDLPLMDLLLHAGAPLDSGDSRALQLAILRKDHQTLQTLLTARPSPDTLSQAFALLRQGYTAIEKLQIARVLLEHGARGSDVNSALVDAIADTSTSRDTALITELVRYGADVNFENGKALRLAVAQADMSIVQLLCKSKPSSQTTSAAFPVAFRPDGTRHNTTLPILELLLSNGVVEGPAVEALQKAINGGVDNLDIIDRFVTLAPSLLDPAFQCAVALNSSHLKAPLLTHLLTIGITQMTLDEALIKETKQIISDDEAAVLEILVRHGASINYKEGESLVIGVSSGSSTITRILLQGKDTPSRATVTRAFRTLFRASPYRNTPEKPNNLVSIARELLQRSVEQAAIDSALRLVLDDSNANDDIEIFVDLFLEHSANVNIADGTCFVFAVRRQNFGIFSTLLAHNPDFKSIVPTLLTTKLDENLIVKALQLCFESGCTSDNLEARNATASKLPCLVLAMQEYPRSEAVMAVFLSHGCNPDTTASAIVDSDTGNEALTALLYAIGQPQKRVSDSVLMALLTAGASPTRSTSVSEISPIALAAREGRHNIALELLKRGADPSIRDKANRSALFHASSSSIVSIVEAIAPHALKDDGSLHEAARCLNLEIATILLKRGHNPNFPSRLHGGRNALGEFCLATQIKTGSQRTKLRQILRLFLDNGANAKLKVRNEKSAVLLTLDNPYNPLEISEALLETEVWEDLNSEQHMYRDSAGLWYSPIKYVELIASPSRASCKQQLIELLRDKGCEPKFYSEHAEQPPNAMGMPAPIAKLHDREKEHRLSLKHAKEVSEHERMLDEAKHRDSLRRKQEQQDADMASAASAQAHWTSLEQQKHEFEMNRVRSAERMKRTEKVAWYNLAMEQERDGAVQRAQIEDRKAKETHAHEAKLMQQRQAELEHRTGVERKALKEKEELYERNVKRQLQVTERVDQSAQLHASLNRPAIQPANWGNVD